MAARRTTIDEQDRELLRFLAVHRVATAAQVPVLLGTSPRRGSERLRRLEQERLLSRDRIFAGRPAMVAITPSGRRAIGSKLSPAGVSLTEYRHDLGVSWLWLAARDGAFGPVRELVAERELRGTERRKRSGDSLPDVGRHPGERHRPDLLLTTAAGKRIAIELELTPKAPSRLEQIMLGFAGDPEVDAVLYLVPTPGLARLVATAAERAGIAEMVHVQRLAPGAIHGAPELGQAPARARGSGAGRAGAAGAKRAGRGPGPGRVRGGAER